VIGAVGALVIHPAYGAAAGVATVVAARWPARRHLLTVSAVSAVALTGAFAVVRQVVSAPLPGFGWATRFESVHRVALLAVLLVAADALVTCQHLRRGPSLPWPAHPTPEDS
jgi:hypothetical protein